MHKLIVIVGPTASGKSALAVKLAKKYNGEIISADSRQVYRGMDIGTGKIRKKEMGGVPHYLLDVASPKRKFTVTQYRAKAISAIRSIVKRGKIPFLVGGTGFYIEAVIHDTPIPDVPPDWKLRREFEKKSVNELFTMLKKLDPRRARSIEQKNKRRLIRALEIIEKTGKPVPKLPPNAKNRYNALVIGIRREKNALHARIKKRLIERMKYGMRAEAKRLHDKEKVSWKRLEELGLEYRWLAKYLQGKVARGEMLAGLQKDIEDYARRQIVWFKRDKQIHWVKTIKQAEEKIKTWNIKHAA